MKRVKKSLQERRMQMAAELKKPRGSVRRFVTKALGMTSAEMSELVARPRYNIFHKDLR